MKVVQDTTQSTGVVIVYFLFVADPVKLGLSQCFWELVTKLNKLTVLNGLHQLPLNSW